VSRLQTLLTRLRAPLRHMWRFRVSKRCDSLEEKHVVVLNGHLQSQTLIVLSLHRGVLARPGLEDVPLF